MLRTPRRATLALLLVTGLAHAEPTPADLELAQERFRTGAKAFKANRFAVAVQSFEQAYQLDPRPETAFSIAQANRLQYYLDKNAWRLQRALQLYEVYLAELPSGSRAQDASDRIGELGPLVKELRERGELVPYAPEPRTQLVVGAEVDVATVKVDGKPTILWEPLDVTPGPHVVELEAPGFELAQRRVTVPAGQFLPIDINLRPKPGRLALTAEADATIYVDGQRRGTSAGAFELALAPGSHFVSAVRRGRNTWSRTIIVERDQTLRVDAQLVPTAQRRIARWVLLSAGGLGVGALGVGVWSYATRREAQELDETRIDLGATPADLVRYNELVDAAETRQSIALGLGIGAAAIGALGLGMWWFDQPPPDADDGLAVRPVIDPSGLGMMVQGQF